MVLVVIVRSEAHSGNPERKVERERRTEATTEIHTEHRNRRATRERNFDMETRSDILCWRLLRVGETTVPQS